MRWIGLRSPSHAWPTAMAVFGIYFAIDLLLMLSAGASNLTFLFLAINYPAKFLACYFGGRHAANRGLATAA